MKQNYKSNLKKYGALTGSFMIAGSNIATAQVDHTDITDEYQYSSDNDFDIDIDGDGTMDVRFSGSYNYYYSGPPSYIFISYSYSNISGLNGTTFVDSDYNNYVTDMPSGVSVRNGGVFISGTSLASSFATGDFGGQGDKYVGVKFDISGETHYGWILINVSNNGNLVIIKEYAYETTPDADINTGDVGTPTGLLDELAANATVYPNPTADIVNVEGVDVLSISVKNSAGAEVLSSTESSINVSSLATGTYLVVITTEEGDITKSIIKE